MVSTSLVLLLINYIKRWSAVAVWLLSFCIVIFFVVDFFVLYFFIQRIRDLCQFVNLNEDLFRITSCHVALC